MIRQLIFSLVVSLPLAAGADDWPQWRGLNRDGVWHESGVVEKFPDGGLPVLWRRPAGAGWSSPVIVKGRVYVIDAELTRPKAHERVVCLDEETGRLIWTQKWEASYPDWCFTAGQENGPTGTPVVKEGHVFVVGQLGNVLSLNAETGSVEWKRDLGADVGMKEFSSNASPLIEGNLLIMLAGGKPNAGVVALDIATGAERWRALDEATAHSSPVIIKVGKQRQLIVWTQQSVSALEPQSGKLLWSQRLLTSADNAISTPVIDGDRLLISGLMFQLHELPPSATILWPDARTVTKRVLSNTSTPLLRDGYVYSAHTSGGLVCLDAASGNEIWHDDHATAPKQGSALHLTINGSSVLIFNDQGELIRARLTPQGYVETSRSHLLTPEQLFGGKKVTWSPPSYANHKVFVRNQHEMVCASLAAEK